MNGRGFRYGSATVLSAPLAGEAQKEAAAVFTVVQDRVYRSGVFLVIDALVENRSAARAESVEIMVEFYNFLRIKTAKAPRPHNLAVSPGARTR